MNYSQKLLTALKAAHGLPSNYMAAKVLQLSETAIRRVFRDGKQFNEENIKKIAILSGIDPHEAVLHLRIETSNPETRETWEEILAVYQIAQAHAAQGLQADKESQEEAVSA